MTNAELVTASVGAKASPPIIIGNESLACSFHCLNGVLLCGRLAPRRDVLSFEPPQAGLNYCRELELVLGREGRGFAARSRSLGGCGEQFQFLGCEEKNNGSYILEHWREDLQLRAFSHYEFTPGAPVVRRRVSIRNEGREPADLEALASAVAYHLARPDADIRLHVPFSSWSGEAQWQAFTATQAGLATRNASHYRACCVGSRSSAEHLPMAMLEDVERGLTWFWQIEHSASWMWEVGHLFVEEQHGYYFLAGGPDEKHGHWWKQLQPGETFQSIPVALGVIQGGFEEAVGALTRHRRAACRRPHPVDDGLPVIFNDYMNCLWGNPTLEGELPLIDAAARAGCEVFCLDSGWYAAPDEHWWPGVGEWNPNKERFPGDAFDRIFAEIRERGMVPGIWLEAEAVGVLSPVASQPENWFLHRHGRRVQYNRRYFWNLRNPEVIAYLDGIIDRLVERYGIGYIKNDYNIDLLQGVEDDADSFGDGLLEHTRALYRWIESIHQRHPKLIWENCAAGGLRVDYGILSRAQLQSSSDQENCHASARLVGASLSAILPEQCAVWAYPLKTDSEETVILNMVNVLLCRVHLSGHLAELSPVAFALVQEGLALYKNHRSFIKTALPIYPLGTSGDRGNCPYVAFGLRGKGKTLLAIWKLSAAPGSVTLPWPSMHCSPDASVQVAYPASERYSLNSDSLPAGLVIHFGEGSSARLFSLEDPPEHAVGLRKIHSK
jgi:alpha-galactosidase